MTNVHVEDVHAACPMMEPFLSFAEPVEQNETNSTHENPKGGCYARDHRFIDEWRMRCRLLRTSQSRSWGPCADSATVLPFRIFIVARVSGADAYKENLCRRIPGPKGSILVRCSRPFRAWDTNSQCRSAEAFHPLGHGRASVHHRMHSCRNSRIRSSAALDQCGIGPW